MTNEIVPVKNTTLTLDSWHLIQGIVSNTTISTTEKVNLSKKLLFCFENRLPLSLAMFGGLYVVKNRLEVEGNVIRAQINNHPRYSYKIAELTNEIATMELYYDSVLVGTVSWSKQDAIDAKLWSKDNYQNFPADMLLNRATSRLYKRFCPEIFSNTVYVKGEINGDDAIEGEIVSTSKHTMQSLIDEFGHEIVLDGLQKVGNNPDDIYNFIFDEMERMAEEQEENE